MRDLIRPFLPQWLINYFWHLPNAILANIKYGFPARKITVIGVTGTDGKTTTTNMIYQILKSDGKKVSMVSTINAVIAGKDYDTGFHVTSPDSFTIQKFLSQSVMNGDKLIILEVTSHAIDQFRFFGINFETAVITNITHEHLDYHKSFKNYFDTKSKLIKNSKFAILNIDEVENYKKLSKIAQGKVISFGLERDGDFNLKKIPLDLKIPGQFNKLNALAAAAAASCYGVNTTESKKALEQFSHLKGRMNKIANKSGLNIYIDFAHTPNGLENAIKALKPKSKKMISIFGAPGYRDEQKRPMMGEIATRLSDYVVITAEDPRGLIEQINKQILEGVKKAGGVLNKNIFIENDRQRAISFAINELAKNGDTVGIFGKGHEQSINLDGKGEIPWSDQEAVLKALNDRSK